MSLSTPFIERPIATTLLTAAVALAGIAAYHVLPVSPLPQVDFPTISISAGLPGASPEIMASSVSTPLEREFGRIASVTEMTAQSTLGQTSITLQFDLSRNIDAATRDVESAINAARSYLPANLPTNPTYRKVNPADAPIMIVALTSNKLAPSALYDAASTILQQRLSQIAGVGQVVVGGSSAPAVRIDLNPTQLHGYGLELEDVRTAIAAQTVNQAKGHFSNDSDRSAIVANDQLMKAADYQPLIVSYSNGTAVRLSDVANVQDSVQTVRSLGMSNGKRSALIIIFRQPGANIISTVDGIKAALPQLHASIDSSIDLTIALDQTQTIRASVSDIERTLLISVVLVVLVVFLFLREFRSTLIPLVAVPVSLIGTLAVMYLLGYSIDNLSLMALTISTGFVVDDAIVVLENITRYKEAGMNAMAAAHKGAAEIGFTVLSMSTSLVAVFIPILLMGGIIGRLFREFAVTLSVTIIVSLVISLTTTPMMCSLLLADEHKHGKLYLASERAFEWVLGGYERSLRKVLDHSLIVLLIAIATIGLSAYLAIIVPKGFFPQQDTGRLNGSIIADQDISFQAMQKKIQRLAAIAQEDPGVDTVVLFTGGGGGTTTNTGRVFMSLKPLAMRSATADQIINRLRPEARYGRRRDAVSAGRAGCQDRRPAKCRAIPIHDPERQPTAAQSMGPDLARRDEEDPSVERRQQRSAEPRFGGEHRDRSRDGLAPRHIPGSNRQRALRRVRRTGYREDLYAAQSVFRRHGSGAELLAGPSRARQRIHLVNERRRRALVDRSAVRQCDGPARGQPHGRFSVGHVFLQSRARRSARRRRQPDRRSAAQHRHADDDYRIFRRHGASVHGVARERILADRRCDRRCLRGARDSLRELHSSGYDHFYAALGGRRSTVGVADHPHRSHRDRLDWHHIADRYRQEERDHDDRFCNRGGEA
jgi:multidrug efflux pump subunit AcrB